MKLIVLVGIPGSGKSTYTHLIKNDNTVVINRDSIRESLFSLKGKDDIYNYYNSETYRNKEMLVTTVSEQVMNVLIHSTKTVILDNTNLNIDHLKTLVNSLRGLNVEIEFVVFKTSFYLCEERNNARIVPVPSSTMLYMKDSLISTNKWLNENYLNSFSISYIQ